MPEEPATITVSEAAELIGMTPQSVREAIEEGRLKGRRAGGIYLVDARAARDFQKVGHRPRRKE